MSRDQKSGGFRFKWERAVFESQELSGTAKLVLYGLAVHADMDGGSSSPSQETLAKGSKKSERTVRRALKEAEAAGFIVKHRRQYGMDRMSNRYDLVIPGQGSGAVETSAGPPSGGDGYTIPASCEAAGAAWRKDSSTVALWLDARTSSCADSDGGMFTTELFSDYRAWCETYCFPTENLNNFSKALVRLLGPPKHTNRGSLHPLLLTNTAKGFPTQKGSRR